MSRLTARIVIACLLAAVVLGLAPPSARCAEPRPNIVFIFADDLGWADLGCTGSTFYSTPRLDQLAAEGMSFSDAYAACPVCSPSRAALMTGRWPARVGITDYIGGARRGKLLPADYLHELPHSEVTIAEALKKAGYAMIEDLDTNVGRVLDKLDELRLAERTIVIFTSDNGGLSTSEGSPTSNAPLRAGKGWLYEGGVRVPLFVRWPGVVKPGSTSAEPVTTTDYFPTILEMCGLAQHPEWHIDGVSLVPVLRGGAPLRPRPLFWHYPHYGNQGGVPGGSVRAGDWKLIEFFEDDHVELYNLKNDPGERNDLAAAEPERAGQLRQRLGAWRDAVGAKMPTPNPHYTGRTEVPPKKNRNKPRKNK